MNRLLNNLRLLFFIIVAIAFFNACSLITLENAVDPLPINELNARIMTHDFNGTILEVIDEAADYIITNSDESRFQINALRWKINGVSTSRDAIFQTDPILALTDTWIFMHQMQDFFKQGAGKDAFGPHQHIAQQAMQDLVTSIDSIAIAVIKREDYLTHKNFVEYYVTNNPLADFDFKRESSPFSRIIRSAFQ